MFLFDENREKIDRINELLDQVSQELHTSKADADSDEDDE